MAERSFALFDTPVGRCGLAWHAAGITRIALPGPTDAATHALLARRAGEAAPPPAIAEVIAQITGHLRGEPSALEHIALDMEEASPFDRPILAAARTIPSGRTTTYGALARRLGTPGGARAIGQAMGRNPFPIVVPCHRVVAASHGTGGFSAHGGVETKARLLAIEGFTLPTQPSLPFGGSPLPGRARRAPQ